MKHNSFFHVFRNTPFGRDIFLQSALLAKRAGVSMTLYIPQSEQFLMYFSKKAVTVDLSRTFLHDPESAMDHAKALIAASGVKASFFVPRKFTAVDLPDVPVHFSYMCCPRSISDLSARFGRGNIGPKVRQIVQHAKFPVMIPTPVYKPWNQIVVFYGGSVHSLKAIREGLALHRNCGLPISLFTSDSNQTRGEFEQILREQGLWDDLVQANFEWMFFNRGGFNKNLYQVPSDALLVLGAYGRSLVKEVLFGSKAETIQATLPNNMLIVGPQVR